MNSERSQGNLLISILLIVAFACNGQHQPAKNTTPQPSAAPVLGEKVEKIGSNIRCIYEDNNESTWFASDGDGLYQYDGKVLLRYTEKEGLPSNTVRYITRHNDGTLLIVTGKGVCSFDGKKISIVPNASGDFALNISSATILQGDYYEKGYLNKLPLTQTSRLTKNYSQTPYAVYCSLKDSKGNIWLGTESRGVCKYDGKNFTWVDDPELVLAIRCIFEDSKGNIWIGNNGYGLFRYDGKVLTNVTKQHKLENPRFLTTLEGKEGTLARVWSITEDKQGNLWIGTIDAGLWKYNGKEMVNFTPKDGLPGMVVSAVFCDSKGNIWIGSDTGVTVFDGKGFKAFGK